MNTKFIKLCIFFIVSLIYQNSIAMEKIKRDEIIINLLFANTTDSESAEEEIIQSDSKKSYFSSCSLKNPCANCCLLKKAEELIEENKLNIYIAKILALQAKSFAKYPFDIPKKGKVIGN